MTASDFAAQQLKRTVSIAQREADVRAGEEMKAWWQAVCAALTGAAVPNKAFPEEYCVQRAAEIADRAVTALSARRNRGEGHE